MVRASARPTSGSLQQGSDKRLVAEYEDDEYYKDTVQVETDSGGAVSAYVYVWQEALR